MFKNQLVDGLKMSQVFMFFSTIYHIILGKYLGWLVEITRIIFGVKTTNQTLRLRKKSAEEIEAGSECLMLSLWTAAGQKML